MIEIYDLHRSLQAALVALYAEANDLEIHCVCQTKKDKAGLEHELHCPFGALGVLAEGLKKQNLKPLWDFGEQ